MRRWPDIFIVCRVRRAFVKIESALNKDVNENQRDGKHPLDKPYVAAIVEGLVVLIVEFDRPSVIGQRPIKVSFEIPDPAAVEECHCRARVEN